MNHEQKFSILRDLDQRMAIFELSVNKVYQLYNNKFSFIKGWGKKQMND